MNANAYGNIARYPVHCDRCEFIGTDGVFDLFRCENSLISGLVWRYGDGPDYTTIPETLEALRFTLGRNRAP
jgi:hypothetical protein